MEGRVALVDQAGGQPRPRRPLLRARPSALAVAAAATVVGVAVAVDPAGLAPFGPSKWAVATTGTLVVVAAAARLPGLRVARLPTALFGGLVAWAGVTAVPGLDPLYAWIGTPERRWGVAAWALSFAAFAAGQQVRGRDARVVAAAVCGAAGVAGLWAGAEALGWEPFDVSGGSGRPGGPFGSSAYLGAFAALTLPVAVAVGSDRSMGRAVRSSAAGAAVAAGVALAASGARAAWGGALVAGMAWAVARRPPLRRLALAAGVAAALVLVTGVGGRIPALASDERGGVRGRLDEWRVAARVVADRPLFGTGPEGYRIAFSEAVDPRYEQAHGRSPLPDRAHSAVLDVAATLGVPGAAAYLALLAVLGSFLLRGIRSRDRLLTGASLGVLAYFAQSLVLFPVPELDVVAWLLAGTVVGATMRSDEGRWARVPRPMPAIGAVAAVAALVLGVLDVAADRASASGGDPHRAMRLRPDALRYRLVAARGHEAEGTVDGLDAALAELDGARRLSPQDPVVRAEHGRLLLDRARRTGSRAHVEQARTHLEASARRDPHNAETQLRLGLARALDGDDAGAERAWLVAERLAPRSAAASTNLALAYARLGRTEEARAAARRALQRDPDATRAADLLRLLDGT